MWKLCLLGWGNQCIMNRFGVRGISYLNRKAQRGHQQSSCLTIWCCIHKVTRYLGLDSHSISKVSTEIFIKLKNLRIHPQIPNVTTIRWVWMSVSLTKVSTEALFKLNKPNKMEFRFQSSLITELRIQRFLLSSACLL